MKYLRYIPFVIALFIAMPFYFIIVMYEFYMLYIEEVVCRLESWASKSIEREEIKMIANDELEQYMCKKYEYCGDCPAGIRSWGCIECSFEHIAECLQEYENDRQ